MEYSSVTQVAFLSACVISVTLTLLLLNKSRQNPFLWPLVGACALHSLWSLAIGLQKYWLAQWEWLIPIEFMHYAGWSLAVVFATERYCDNPLPRYYRQIVWGILGGFLILNLLQVSGWV